MALFGHVVIFHPAKVGFFCYNLVMVIPEIIRAYLWDVDVTTLSPKKHHKFIIERVLEYGDFAAVEWLAENFEKEQIIEVLRVSKRISPKTGNFFAMYYKVPKESFECLKNPFTQKQNRF